MRFRCLAGAATFAVCLASAGPAAARDEPSLTVFGAGLFDVNKDPVPAIALEWRGAHLLWTLRPFVGAGLTGDAGIYGYAGIALDLFLGRNVVVTPNFASALYSRGDGKDLGSALEFRSGIEIAYRFDDFSRLGIAYHHISNASIDETNPGAETLMLNYAVPLQYLFGH